MTKKDADAGYRYQMTMKMFGTHAEPAFETRSQLESGWGRNWGCDTDVGQLRVVLVHRPGNELDIVDPSKRIEETGTFGDIEEGWYWQSDTIPPADDMRSQHDALASALGDHGVEVVYMDEVGDRMLKSCYTRDSVVAIKGGAIVCRLANNLRRGEERHVSRTLSELGVPILRTVHGTGMMEGGSFTWLNSKTVAIGRSVRVNEEGIAQVEEVLNRQGVEVIRVDMAGYQIHIDGAFVMVDVNLALINPVQLPFVFLEKLKELKIDTVDISPTDDGWIVNSLAIAPGKVLMPEGISNRTHDALDRRGVEIVTVPYAAMQLNGGGIHCSTSPLLRDSID